MPIRGIYLTLQNEIKNEIKNGKRAKRFNKES